MSTNIVIKYIYDNLIFNVTCNQVQIYDVTMSNLLKLIFFRIQLIQLKINTNKQHTSRNYFYLLSVNLVF